MASSHGKISVTTSSSPKHGKINVTTSSSPKEGGGSSSAPVSSPKGQCLCSPTTHQGSFRCKFHRSSDGVAWFKRSKSMPPARNVTALSPKSVEST